MQSCIRRGAPDGWGDRSSTAVEAVMPKSAQSIIVIALISLGTTLALEHYRARTGKAGGTH